MITMLLLFCACLLLFFLITFPLYLCSDSVKKKEPKYEESYNNSHVYEYSTYYINKEYMPFNLVAINLTFPEVNTFIDENTIKNITWSTNLVDKDRFKHNFIIFSNELFMKQYENEYNKKYGSYKMWFDFIEQNTRYRSSYINDSKNKHKHYVSMYVPYSIPNEFSKTFNNRIFKDVIQLDLYNVNSVVFEFKSLDGYVTYLPITIISSDNYALWTEIFMNPYFEGKFIEL